MFSKLSNFVHIPPIIRLPFIVFLLLFTAVVVAVIVNIMIYFTGPIEYKDECSKYISLYYKEARGRVYRVDSSYPGRGVWVFVRNQQLNERYGFSSYEAIRNAVSGDSVYKLAQSNYGWIIKDSLHRKWILLRDNYPECDSISPERVQAILQQHPDIFKIKWYE